MEAPGGWQGSGLGSELDIWWIGTTRRASGVLENQRGVRTQESLGAKKLRPNPGYEPLLESDGSILMRLIDRTQARERLHFPTPEPTIPANDPSRNPKSQPRRKTHPRKDFQKASHPPNSSLASSQRQKNIKQANMEKVGNQPDPGFNSPSPFHAKKRGCEDPLRW